MTEMRRQVLWFKENKPGADYDRSHAFAVNSGGDVADVSLCAQWTVETCDDIIDKPSKKRCDVCEQLRQMPQVEVRS